MKRILVILTLVVLGTMPNLVQAQEPSRLAGIFKALEANGKTWFWQMLSWTLEREATDRIFTIMGLQKAGPGGKGSVSQTRFSWAWLAVRMDKNEDGVITADEFTGPMAWFKYLDRDGNGKITSEDLDWSTGSKLTRAGAQARALMSQIDTDKNGQITLEEWQEFMKKLAKGKTYLSQDDLLPLFLNDPKGGFGGKRKGGGGGGNFNNPKGKLTRDMAYLNQDVASWYEGPSLNARAPDFTLKSPDGKKKFTLSASFGKKPTVIIFGSFT